MKPIIDMHNHTFLSACCMEEAATAEAFINKAAEVGIQVLGISNHCWDDRMPGASPWYAPQTVEWCKTIRAEMPADTKGVKVFLGIESEYKGATDELGISAEGAKEFDYVLIPHTHTHMVGYVIPNDPPYLEALAVMEKRLREAFPEVSDRQIEKWMSMARQPDVKKMLDVYPVDHQFVADFMCDSFVGLLNNAELQKVKDTVPTFVAHPFIAGGYSYQDSRKMVEMIPDEKFIEMFTLMAEKGVGYDISICNFDVDHPETCQMHRLVRLAKQCGVKFLFGTDAHNIKGLERAVNSARIFENIPLTKEDLHPMYRGFVK